MDCEEIVEPTTEVEAEFLRLLEDRSREHILALPQSERHESFGVMWGIYDFHGLPEMNFFFRYQTEEGVRRYWPPVEGRFSASDEQEARWNPGFWWSAENEDLVDGRDQELLSRLDSEYKSRSSHEDEENERAFVMTQVWGLVTGWVRTYRQSALFAEWFPSCEIVLVGNGCGDGECATRLANPFEIPSEVWTAGLG